MRWLPFQHGLPGLEPLQLTGPLGPELQPLPGAFLVDAVGLDVGVAFERRWRRKRSLLPKQCFDPFAHESSRKSGLIFNNRDWRKTMLTVFGTTCIMAALSDTPHDKLEILHGSA